MGETKVGLVHGKVEHVMTEGGTLGSVGSEYALASMPPETLQCPLEFMKNKKKKVVGKKAHIALA